MSELDLFTAALAQPIPEACAAFLNQHCADNPPLRARLEQLLSAYRQADDVLPTVPQAQAHLTGTYRGQPEKPSLLGTVIAGRYKLLEVIGEGGMGTVFVAEQTEPVKRKVYRISSRHSRHFLDSFLTCL